MTGRKLKVQKILFMLIAISFATSVCAQTPLSLQDAVKIGLENSKSLKIAELNVLSAKANADAVNASRWATLSFKGGYSRLSEVPPFELTLPASIPIPGLAGQSFTISQNVYDVYNTELTVQQPVFTGFQLENSAKAAEYNAKASAFDTKADKSDLKVQIATAYWNLYATLQARKVMQQNLERTKSHYEQAKNMMSQGMLTQSDVLSAKVQVSNGELSLLTAENNVKLAVVSLNNILGVPLPTQYVITSRPQTGDTTLPSISSLLKKAIENRPELRSLDLKASAAKALKRAAWGAYLPQISIFGDYYYQKPNQRYEPVLNTFKGTWDAGVVISLPIWNWGETQDKVDKAQAQSEQADLAEKQMADAVYLDVTQSYLNFQQARDKIAVATETVKDAEESYRISDQKFKVGLVTNTDLMDAEIALLQANLSYTQALTGLEIARVSLEKATGEL
ncbi:MAG: TolC family protein [Bacteroidetes bacterium]|nr:TolC family protein [Bacteroidota bacterium]